MVTQFDIAPTSSGTKQIRDEDHHKSQIVTWHLIEGW